MAKKKVIKVKKSIKVDVVANAIKLFKKDEPDWKQQDQWDLYAIESYIDGLLYEKKYAKYGYTKGSNKVSFELAKNSELILERLVFEAIRRMQGGKRHTCDIYYDDAFGGRDGF